MPVSQRMPFVCEREDAVCWSVELLMLVSKLKLTW